MHEENTKTPGLVTPPTLSVIIPVLNQVRYLRRAVESVWASTQASTEIIIVDDGSGDGTLDLASRLADSSGGTIRVLRHADGVRHGVSACRNLGVRMSRGEFIAFLDGDDEYLSNRFSSVLELFQTDPDLEGVYGDAVIRYENDAARMSIDWNSDIFGIPEKPSGRALVDFLARGQGWHVSAITIRRSLVKRCGDFREDMPFAEDCQYWLRMGLVGNVKPLLSSEPISVYWRHGTNTYSSQPERRIDMVRALVSASCWGSRHGVSSADVRLAMHGAMNYLQRTLVVLRERGELQLALKAVAIAFREGAGYVLADMSIVRQLVSLSLSWLTPRKRAILIGHELLIRLPWVQRMWRRRLEVSLEQRNLRVALVKQDVQDDLYCCPRGIPARDVVASSLMRSGPVALFTKLGAEFLTVKTVDDPECGIWKEKATVMGWYGLGELEGLREHVLGRAGGQGQFAIGVDDVDWSGYDLVISIDVAVPARITRRFPGILWCYYVREPKTPAGQQAMVAPATGWDVYLNQCFAPQRWGGKHVVDFPYYLQYPGCFQELGFMMLERSARRGVFLEHHTPAFLDAGELERLGTFGPVTSTADGVNAVPPGAPVLAHRSTMRLKDRVESLGRSRYFLQVGGRREIFGNGMVEAICCGCLALGDPSRHTHGFLFSGLTAVRNAREAYDRIAWFERHPDAFERELGRQARAVEHLCYFRPVRDLLRRRKAVMEKRR